MKKRVLTDISFFLAIIVIAVMYVYYNWKDTEGKNVENVFRISKSIEAALPKGDLKMLDATAEDISKPQYQLLKKTLENIIRINPEAKSAYIYTKKNGKIYFIVDSEPIESKDYSPPGQEYVDAKPEDIQPFIDGKFLMTKPPEDRWGRWRSALIPIKDEVTNKTIAVFGMDYSIKSWHRNLINEGIHTGILIALVLIFIVLLKVQSNNKFLKFNNDELQKTKDTLKESEDKYRIITQSTLDTIFMVDKFGKLLFFNESLERLLGYKVEELVGRSFTEVVPKGEWANYFTQLKNIFLHQEVGNFITKVYHKDGHLVDVEINGKLIRQRGEYLGQGTIRDITERKKAEEELKNKNEQLSKLVAEKDKFFSIIAHDLRSPFNGFLGLTQIMVEELPGLSGSELQSIAQSLKESATNLYNLLENLLNWSLIQQDMVRFDPQTFQLLPIVSECLAVALQPAKSKKIEIVYNVPNDLEVLSDINMLQTVIRNLVSNAVKFTPKGGKISLSAQRGINGIEISIKDSGIGMSPTQADNLFRLDFQFNRKGTEGEPSSGLGLLLCKEFIEKHGGQIWVKSKEGKGSVFYFTLPGKGMKV